MPLVLTKFCWVKFDTVGRIQLWLSSYLLRLNQLRITNPLRLLFYQHEIFEFSPAKLCSLT